METSANPVEAPACRRRWPHIIIAVLLSPLIVPLALVGLAVAILVGVPAMLVETWIVEPLRFHRFISRRGRILDPDDCLARLSRGEGTLLLEETGGRTVRAWWTEDLVDALPPVDLSKLDDDQWDDAEITPAMREAVKQTQQLLQRYTRLADGRALLISRRDGSTFADRARREVPSARIVRLCAWVAEYDLETCTCGVCGYDLAGLESERCPECGTDFGTKVQSIAA